MAELAQSIPVANEDRIPHDFAVWRAYADEPVQYDGAMPPGTAGRRVAIDYGDGQITEGWGQIISWKGAQRWRFGWAPVA